MMWSHSPTALSICNDRDKIALLQWNHHHQQQQQQQQQHAIIHHDDGMDADWMASDYQHADARDGPKKIHHIPSVRSAGGSTTRMLSHRTCATRSSTLSSSRFDHVPLDVDKKMFPKSSASSRRGGRGDTNINTLCDCQSHPLPRSIHVVVSPFEQRRITGEEDEDDIHSPSACSSSSRSASSRSMPQNYNNNGPVSLLASLWMDENDNDDGCSTPTPSFGGSSRLATELHWSTMVDELLCGTD